MDHATQFPRVWGDYFGEEGGGGVGGEAEQSERFPAGGGIVRHDVRPARSIEGPIVP